MSEGPPEFTRETLLEIAEQERSADKHGDEAFQHFNDHASFHKARIAATPCPPFACAV